MCVCVCVWRGEVAGAVHWGRGDVKSEVCAVGRDLVWSVWQSRVSVLGKRAGGLGGGSWCWRVGEGVGGKQA